MRIVLDTNCLVQSIAPRSKYFPVWKSFLIGQNTLCITTEILNEYAEILERLFGTKLAEVVMRRIENAPFIELITPYYQFGLIQADPDDNKFVDCAIAANARYIVSNDHHYDILRQVDFPRVDVVSIERFLQLLLS